MDLREGCGVLLDRRGHRLAALGLRGGRHLMHPEGKTPIANLYVTLLDRLGVPVDAFGDSSGHIEGVAIT